MFQIIQLFADYFEDKERTHNAKQPIHSQCSEIGEYVVHKCLRY